MLSAYKAISEFFPDADTEIVRVATGASGPQVVVFACGGEPKKFALKYGKSRIPISQQLENRKRLAPHFEDCLVPVLRQSINSKEEEDAILMPAYDANLHEVVMAGSLPDDVCLEIWSDVLDRVKSLWLETRTPWNNPNGDLKRNPKNRFGVVEKAVSEWVIEGLNRPLGHYWDNEVVINGREYPSLKAIFAGLSPAYQTPTILVLCHGDLNANNIMIEETSWKLADWEWCGEHDWRLSCSHLIGWWRSNSVTHAQSPQAVIDGRGRLILNYWAEHRSLVSQLISKAQRFVEEFASEVDEVESSPLQMKIMLSTLLFGEIRFLESRNIPPSHAIYLIGEAIRTRFK